MTISEILIYVAVAILIGCGVVQIIYTLYYSEPTLNFKGHFKPRRHFFYEKCSKCGKRLKHYHWFWGKGDFMACDVDYHGKTEWYCKKCDAEMSKNAIHEIPHI